MTRLARPLLTSLCALCLMVAALPSDAASRGKKSKDTGPKVTYADGRSGAERQRSEDARLTRECKGRPNAGACLGYAR
ncbi:MAG: hypothetical protein LCH89_17650 [Proteobacteria bacterium]|nr:hypothetical protein [Pseudomonadota bacterium]